MGTPLILFGAGASKVIMAGDLRKMQFEVAGVHLLGLAGDAKVGPLATGERGRLRVADRGPRGISCVLVEKGTKGFSFGKKEDKLGIRCSETRQLIFEDCEIPAENIVGGKENMGFLHALKTLNASRPAVAALAVGTAQGAFDCAIKYAREREQFGVKIASFQAIQHMLADMAMKIEASRLMTYKAAKMLEIGHKDLARHSAMAKCFAADSAMQVCTDAVQIYGGYGFTKEYPVEKYFRDAKILQIYEGTSQIQRNEIAAGLIKEAASGSR